jgi:hypothetical protein
MIITKNEGILRELNTNYIRDAEERMERGREIGLCIKGEWKEIKTIKSREIYEELMWQRYGQIKEEEMKKNQQR